MARPVAYHSNLFSVGTLSGDNASNSNPVGRVADGSVNLPYVSHDAPAVSGGVAVTLATAGRPDALVLVRSDFGSAGFRLESDDVGGGSGAIELTGTHSSTQPQVVELASGTDRRVWTLTAIQGGGGVSWYEAQLATKYQLPRSPDLQVTRTKVRQFTRIPVAGGQPFVKRDGPGLRRTLYTFVLISGTEVTEAEAFVDAVGGGQAFTFTDDREETYWAELLDGSVTFQDTAGVFTVSLTFQEISAEL